MTSTAPRLKEKFDALAQALVALKGYDANLDEKAEAARLDLQEVQADLENIRVEHEWFYNPNEEEFERMSAELHYAAGVCYDVNKYKDIVDNPKSSQEEIEEAETAIAFRRDNFKAQIEAAERTLKVLYYRGQELAGQWEEATDFVKKSTQEISPER